MRFSFLLFGLLLAMTHPATAQDVAITAGVTAREFTLNDTPFTIQRNQDTENHLTGDFAKTSRPCPPFCITPMQIAPGVTTLGELELMDFLQTEVSAGTGLLIDARVPEWFAKGSIPGAVNVPFATLDAANPFRDEILKALGAQQNGAAWDYAEAMQLTLFSNGVWSDQSPRAIHSLLDAGYPADKIKYYRGGMQSWLQLGLNVGAP